MFNALHLHERLLKALESMGLQEPTPIQSAMIPPALAGRDIQASAETGSGKTAAYLLPILHQMLEKSEPATATRALILLPTRELALQVDKHCRDLAAFTQIKTCVLVGGTSYTEQKALLRKNPEFVIGTPGRVQEHVHKKAVVLDDLEFLVLDEADRMLDMGFREEVMSIVQACRRERQTCLLSATLEHDGIGRIAEDVLREPEIVAIGTHRAEHAAITQQAILADDPAHKKQLASWLLANSEFEKALVFTNTREHAAQLAAFLLSQRDKGKRNSGPWQGKDRSRSRVACLHGEMEQDERKRIMHWFRMGTVRILVATDVAARGLDVEGVDLVLNFELARSGDDHVHRVGRTGRAGRQGVAISLVAPQEWNLMCSIERYLDINFERRSVEGMEARFKGPVKKTGTRKKKPERPAGKKKEVPKAQQRHSYKKNIGKRRKPSDKPDNKPDNKPNKVGETAAVVPDSAGRAPLKRKTSPGKPQ